MGAYGGILASLFKRALVALPFFLVGFLTLFRAGGGMMGGFGMGLLGCAAFLAGAIVLAFPLARLIAEPAGNLFWPGRRFKRAQPVYSIPESKRARGLYEEALAGFERIALDYPGEVRPYIEMINIAVLDLRDPTRARDIYEAGAAALKRPRDREVLLRSYSRTCSRLHTVPSN